MKPANVFFSTLLLLMVSTCQAQDSRVPVLLELFTSEGCSSCPAADQLLTKIDRSQPIGGVDLIVIGEHVDYWNHDGWADQYSSAAYSLRQQRYASLLRTNDVYTPQLVIDGSIQLVGSDWPKAKSAIEAARHSPKIAISLTPVEVNSKPSTVTAKVDADSSLPAAGVYLALAADSANTQVNGGENSGRHLSHTAVAYSITEIGKTSANSAFEKSVAIPAHSKWGGSVRIIVFLQDSRTGRVLGASQLKL